MADNQTTKRPGSIFEFSFYPKRRGKILTHGINKYMYFLQVFLSKDFEWNKFSFEDFLSFSSEAILSGTREKTKKKKISPETYFVQLFWSMVCPTLGLWPGSRALKFFVICSHFFKKLEN